MISRFRAFVIRNNKYLPVIFFSLGFLWDTMTLGRTDRIYDRIILCVYLSSLTVCLYMYNISDDGENGKTSILKGLKDIFLWLFSSFKEVYLVLM